MPNLGLFRNVIMPWAKRAMMYGEHYAGVGLSRGHTMLKSNLGTGWAALKSNPRRAASGVLGMGTLRQAGMGFRTAGRAMRRGGGMQDPYVRMGLGMGFGSIGKWATGGGYTGAARFGVGAARTGGVMAAADFLNPWGLGWGD
jgi:hypothetical protein